MGSIITLLTDFGTRDGYVAAMKGVLLSIAPEAHLVDITHEVAPQEIAEAAFTLATSWRFFPAGTVHLAVVDPGVGSERRAIAVAAGGHRFVAPDNGVLSLALAGLPLEAVSLENRGLFRPEVSQTFHGRDIFAPVAAHLALGAPLSEAGPSLPDIVRLPEAAPHPETPGAWQGTVVAVDRFGNLVTNIPADLVRGSALRVEIAGAAIGRLSEFYAEAPPGGLLALVGSAGTLEVAVNGGSAADRLQVRRGAQVRIVLQTADP